MKEFNPYSPPETEIAFGPHAGDDEGIWSDGRLLVMTKNAELPDRCLKCNLPADGWKIKRKLMWHKPFWYLLVLLNLMLYVLVAVLVRETAKVRIPLCDQHRRRRRRAILGGWLLALAGIGAIVFGASKPESGLMALAVIGGVVSILVGIILGMVGSRVASVRKIDERFVWLTKVSPEFLAELPPWKIEAPVDNGLEW